MPIACDVPVELRIPVGELALQGTLVIPTGAHGLVLFAHGSGSGRHSPRHRTVAAALQDRGLATLRIDLLTPVEAEAELERGTLRVDADYLAERLIDVTDWIHRTDELAGLPLGYFGASTGAAAALIAAARRPDRIAAIVSRGGRPDLARAALAEVRAPTLLVVGGADHDVLALNRAASRALTAVHRVAVVPGAGHLFEEPGALDEVARLAGDWFLACFARARHVLASPAHARW